MLNNTEKETSTIGKIGKTYRTGGKNYKGGKAREENKNKWPQQEGQKLKK